MQKECILPNKGHCSVSFVEIHWHLSYSAMGSFFPPTSNMIQFEACSLKFLSRRGQGILVSGATVVEKYCESKQKQKGSCLEPKF